MCIRDRLWPFGMKQGRVISKPSVWNLWFKVVAATIPVLIISPLDDWFETRFYNYITVAAMLILYGCLLYTSKPLRQCFALPPLLVGEVLAVR